MDLVWLRVSLKLLSQTNIDSEETIPDIVDIIQINNSDNIL